MGKRYFYAVVEAKYSYGILRFATQALRDAWVVRDNDPDMKLLAGKDPLVAMARRMAEDDGWPVVIKK